LKRFYNFCYRLQNKANSSNIFDKNRKRWFRND